MNEGTGGSGRESLRRMESFNHSPETRSVQIGRAPLGFWDKLDVKLGGKLTVTRSMASTRLEGHLVDSL
jgi:hypothetical protein